jgi:hypothetical protein
VSVDPSRTTVRISRARAGNARRSRCLLAALEANGIEIPRPQRVVLSRDPATAASAATPGGPGEDDLAADSD